MKFKKLNIIFKNTKIQNKNILVVYEYRGYLIAKFRFYTSKLYYNFGQNQYGGFKETWGIFDKETHEIYTQKKKRETVIKACERKEGIIELDIEKNNYDISNKETIIK